MNYSASEDYFNKCLFFDRKQISISKIKKRLFRNFYVLYQPKGFFVHNTFVMEFGEFDPKKYFGVFYGPFFKTDAENFANNLKNTQESFVVGG